MMRPVVPSNTDVEFGGSSVAPRRVVVTIKEHLRTGPQLRRHSGGVLLIESDHGKAGPVTAVADCFGFEPTQETSGEADHILNIVGVEASRACGRVERDQRDRFGFGGGVFAVRDIAQGLVHARKLQHIEVQDIEQTIHGLQAEPALAVEEVGEMRLLKSRSVRQGLPRQLAPVEPRPYGVAKAVLKGLKSGFYKFAKSYTCTFVIFL
jgi:hypothetical protein